MKYYLKKGLDIKKIVFLTIMALQAILFSMIEAWFPDIIGIPGIKPGLSNIVILAILVFFSYSDAFVIILVNCILTSLFTGGPLVFLFSLCGGLLSATIMWILLKSMQRIFSLVGISIAGAIAHNLGQIMIACFVMSELSITAYLPVLLVSGIIMGCSMGFCSSFMVRVLKKMSLIENI